MAAQSITIYLPRENKLKDRQMKKNYFRFQFSFSE